MNESADGIGRPPSSLWERLRAEPDRAPEHIALAAAERFAPAAERWAELTLPHHSPAEAALITHRKHVRMSRLEGGVTGVGGALTSAVDLVGLAWIQGRLTFFIAAAYGFDPRHPMRPAELLALQRVYPTPAAAREGLDGVGAHLALSYLDSKRAEDQQLVPRLVKLVGRRVAKRAALRVVPLLSAPVAAVQNGRATDELGRRAIAYYGGGGTAASGPGRS